MKNLHRFHKCTHILTLSIFIPFSVTSIDFFFNPLDLLKVDGLTSAWFWTEKEWFYSNLFCS